MSVVDLEYKRKGDLDVKDEGKDELTIKELESNLMEVVYLLKMLCLY